MVAIGVHVAVVGLLVWFGAGRHEHVEIGDEISTTFIRLQKQHRITSSAAKVVKSQRTTFTPVPSKPIIPSSLPPPPMPSFDAPPLPMKRIFATSSASGITLPSPAPKPSAEKSSAAPPPRQRTEAPSPPKKTPAGTEQGGYTNAGNVTYVRRVKPVYPAEALRRKQTGTVLLMVFVNESGTVDRIEVLQSSGNPALDAAAVTAEKKSRFSPLVKDGQPVKFKAKVPYRFQIQ